MADRYHSSPTPEPPPPPPPHPTPESATPKRSTPKRSTPKNSTGSRAWWTSRWAIALLLAVLAVVFVVENREPAAIRVLVPLVVMPQWAALTSMLIAGVLIGALLRRRR